MHSAVDKLMSATEIISEGPEGIILESVLEGYAEYYSADLAEKVVRGQTENILKGRCNGGRGTFGYTLDSERKFHIDPLTSPFVLESFRKYNEGSTMKEIRDWLNENGIKNPRKLHPREMVRIWIAFLHHKKDSF